MMLNFWYSDRCNREIKLIVCIVTCSLIYLCSTQQQLSPIFIGFSLLIGMTLHMLRALRVKMAQDNPYKQGFAILFFVFPLMLLITLISNLPSEHKFVLTVQVLGFVGLGLFILSTFPKRKFDHTESQ